MQYPVLNKDSITLDVTETKAKIPLLIKGSWHVPGFGLMSVTDDYITKLTNNFNSNVLGFKPYATLGHLTDSPDPASIDGERKRGDLEEIIREGDVVYGLYNINSDTYNLIKNGEYEYSSPEIQQNFRDKVTGELKGPTLLRTALTNAPFMPFNESKIVALSQGTENIEESTLLCIKLSTNVESKESIIETNIELIDQKENLNNITKMPVENEVIVTTPSQNVETPALDIESILNKVLSNQQAVLNSTIDGITTKFNQTLEAVTIKTNETVNAVVNKVEELSNQLNEVANKTNQIDTHNEFITALSSSDKAKQLNYKLNGLFNNNVSPAAISLAKHIITSASTNEVIKLSVNGTNKEISLEDSIIELVKLSSNSVPTEIQIGAQSTANVSKFEAIIEANKAKAAKLNK